MNSSRVAVCALWNEQAATLLEFMYHSRIVLSVGGSVWYMIRNLHCTVTIDSVLANSKTQNAFLFTENAIFLHDNSLAVEPGSTPRPLVQKNTWRDSLPIDMLLSAESVLIVAQASSEIPEGPLNNPVYGRRSVTEWVWSTNGVILTLKTEIFWNKSIHLSLCLPRILHGLLWDRN